MKKIILRTLIIIFILFFNFISSKANDNEISEENKRYNVNNKIGLLYNTMTYPGIMYQRYLNDDWRVAGSALYLSYGNGNNSDYFFNFGLQVHRILFHSYDVNFYLNAGYGYRYENYKYQQTINFETENIIDSYNYNNLVLGFGTSYTPVKNLTFDLDFGYMYSIETTNSNYEPKQNNDYNNGKTYSIEIGIGIGMFFAF